MSYFQVIPQKNNESEQWHNILQPLALVDYLGPGRAGAKKIIIKWSDREFRKRK